MNVVNIQIQNPNGTWLTLYSMTGPSDSDVRLRMQEASRTHPNNRVRAVNNNGSVVDIL
jgi:hypothetical protein